MNEKTNKKYLLLIPLMVSLIMLAFFSAAFDEIIRDKHRQKFNTVQGTLNFISSAIDRFVEADNDWNTYDYAAILIPLFAEMDEVSLVHVELYNQDLVPLTNHFAEGMDQTIDLLRYDAFVQAVMGSGDSGELTIMIDDGVQSPYEMLVYFKKIPSGEYDNKYIAAYGVSKFAIEENLAPWLHWGVVGLVSMTVLLQLWMILYIAKLSDAERYMKCVADGEGAGT